MPDTRRVEGTVLDGFTKRRFAGATLRLQSADGKIGPALVSADDDGDFTFELEKDKWPDGEYILRAFYPDAQQGEPRRVTLPPKAGHLECELTPIQETSFWGGVGFLVILMLMTGGLFWLSTDLHRKYPEPPMPLDESLSALIDLAAEQAGRLPEERPAPQPDRPQAETAPPGPDPYALVSDTVTNANQVFADLQKETQLVSTRKGQVVTTFFAQAQSAIQQGHKQELVAILGALSKEVQRPESYFWQRNPKRLVEILIWALGATLIRLIYTTGKFVRRKSFHVRAIPHHVGWMVTVPVLALLIAFVLSLVNFTFAIGDVGLQLDMSNVMISIVVAALIGIAPWAAWDFLAGLADTLFRKLAGLFGGGVESGGGS